MTAVRLLNASDAREAIPDLCEILSDCVNGGASVGFMLPFDLETARPFGRASPMLSRRVIVCCWWQNIREPWWVRYRSA